jgi:hypothetical protein
MEGNTNTVREFLAQQSVRDLSKLFLKAGKRRFSFDNRNNIREWLTCWHETSEITYGDRALRPYGRCGLLHGRKHARGHFCAGKRFDQRVTAGRKHQQPEQHERQRKCEWEQERDCDG